MPKAGATMADQIANESLVSGDSPGVGGGRQAITVAKLRPQNRLISDKFPRQRHAEFSLSQYSSNATHIYL